MSGFKRAQRTSVKLKELHTGPSGSGKTKGALHVATTLFPGRVAGIDSENDRMAYYADQFEFDHLSLTSHKPSDYIAAIDLAVAEGYQIAVIDSLTHAWQNVLNRKEAYERANPSKNSYTMWGLFGPEWDKLIRHVLDAPIHIIATARSKQAYELVENSRGKKEPMKLGLAPQVRDGSEYEFAVVFDLNLTHQATCTKDNTGLFDVGESLMWDLCGPKVAPMLRDWLTTAKPAAPRPAPTPEPEPVAIGGVTPKQRALLDRVMSSHVFSDDEKVMAKSADTFVTARSFLDWALVEAKARKAAEKSEDEAPAEDTEDAADVAA